MIPSILAGTKRIAGAGNEYNNLGDTYEKKQLESALGGIGPVQYAPARQPAFRTQDLILGLLPALLGGGANYATEYLKGKMGAAQQLTEQDRANAEMAQKQNMMRGQEWSNFYGNKAKQIRQGQEQSANRFERQQDRDFQAKMQEDRQKQAFDLEQLRAENNEKLKTAGNINAYIKQWQTFAAGTKPTPDEVKLAFEVNGWPLSEDAKTLFDLGYKHDQAMGEKNLYLKDYNALRGITDYSKVNRAPDFRVFAEKAKKYADAGDVEAAQALTWAQARERDAQTAYERAQELSVERLNNERKKGKLTDVQVSRLQKIIDEMPERLRLYGINAMKNASKGVGGGADADFKILSKLATVSNSTQVRLEQQLKTIIKGASSKWYTPTEDELMKNPTYAKLKEELEAARSLQKTVTGRLSGAAGIGAKTPEGPKVYNVNGKQVKVTVTGGK